MQHPTAAPWLPGTREHSGVTKCALSGSDFITLLKIHPLNGQKVNPSTGCTYCHRLTTYALYYIQEKLWCDDYVQSYIVGIKDMTVHDYKKSYFLPPIAVDDLLIH